MSSAHHPLAARLRATRVAACILPYVFMLPAATGALAQSESPTAATATLQDTSGERVGQVELRELPSDGVWLKITVDGLGEGVHGFHIHEKADCGDGFKAAGGHFAPTSNSHGVLSPDGPHAGDFPNIHVRDSGKLKVEYFSTQLTLESGKAGSVFDQDGSAIIIHAGADDYMTDPAGDAGKRVACGVIKNSQTAQVD